MLLKNLDELRCGTDPMRASSVLKVDTLQDASSNQVSLSWRSVPGRQYNVGYSSNLLSGLWIKLNPAPILATNTACTYSPTNKLHSTGCLKVTVP